MARPPLTKIRWLTLGEIAEFWLPELRLPLELIQRELQTGIVNITRLEGGEELLDSPLDEDGLPSLDSRVDREWLAKFCEKQRWDRPRFWFPEDATANPVGRPGHKARSIEKFLERRAAGETEDSISAEAREIKSVLVRETNGGHVSEPKTIQGHIRAVFHRQ